MHILLFDTVHRNNFLPLVATRAVADLRLGLYTLQQRWQQLSGCSVSILTEDYLQPLYPFFEAGDYLLIDAMLKPGRLVYENLLSCNYGEGLQDSAGFIGGKLELKEMPIFNFDGTNYFNKISTADDTKRLENFDQYLTWNHEWLESDIREILSLRKSAPLGEAQVTNPSEIFIEEGAVLEHCCLNASAGPIYIAKNALVMQGAMIRGPFALGEGAVVKMGAKIYGGTNIGPACVAGGEIKNSILFANSNKAHDGYLGDSILGEWCNLGAGTSNSNLKNTADQVKAWSYSKHTFVSAGLKRGLIMGDYSRSAINTSFNTGTVVGVSCNVYGQGFTPGFIPDFSWGFTPMQLYAFEKAVDHAGNWMKLKNLHLDEVRKKILKHIFEHNTNSPEVLNQG